MAKKNKEEAQLDLQPDVADEAPSAEAAAPQVPLESYLVENMKPRIFGYPIVVSESPRVVQTRVLGPGVSVVPVAEFDAEKKKNVSLQHALKQGELAIRAKTKGEGLKGLPEREAASVIAQTFDLKLLREWVSFANVSQATNLALMNRVAAVEAEMKKRGEQEAA